MAVVRKSGSRRKSRLGQNSSGSEFNSRGSRHASEVNISLPKSVQLNTSRPERSPLGSRTSLPKVSPKYGAVSKTSVSGTSPNRQQANSLSSRRNTKAIPVMPDSDSVPLWLMRFFTIHRYSSIVAFGLVATTLMIYGWTVYSQQLWSQASRKLQNLQRDERQLIRANEMLKNKMAREAEQPATGLVLPTPDRAIFMAPSPDIPKTNVTTPAIEPQSNSSPVGY